MSADNFGGSGPTLTKLYQRTWLEAGVIKWTQILQGVPPTKFGRAKKSKKFDAIFDNCRLLLQISPEWIDILKIGKTLDQRRFIPYWVKKIW